QLIEKGLMLMEYKGLVSKLSLSNGFFYKSTDLAHAFIDSMTNYYIKDLLNRSEWAVNQLKIEDNEIYKFVFDRAMNYWSCELYSIDNRDLV
ncbi:ABC-three component system middle component 2, partial [Photobacterium phosphoreum]|uniref:ABC-three component system middle component 2 n=1 Tax=Photobacterium phosphoreum TaxID=659 RepID=UPI0039AF5364